MLSNDYEVLLVSQFTLLGFFSGNKPDYHLASTRFLRNVCVPIALAAHILSQ